MPTRRPGYPGGMAINTRTIRATPEQVWDVLADGWLYPVWVVGATRMRDVDGEWPEVGAMLHHSVGTWPFVLNDSTEVIECTPGSLLTLHARAWPSGKAGVTIRLEPVGGDTEVSIEEDAVGGPIHLLPKVLVDPPLRWRNSETLRRLAFVAEHRSAS